MTMQYWAALLGAYLLGSFPSAYLITRCMTGTDIRQLGDGNMGAKNTWLSVGWLPGLVVGVTDAAKGALAIIVARQLHLPENVHRRLPGGRIGCAESGRFPQLDRRCQDLSLIYRERRTWCRETHLSDLHP